MKILTTEGLTSLAIECSLCGTRITSPNSARFLYAPDPEGKPVEIEAVCTGGCERKLTGSEKPYQGIPGQRLVQKLAAFHGMEAGRVLQQAG